jgi:hypothetical protein
MEVEQEVHERLLNNTEKAFTTEDTEGHGGKPEKGLNPQDLLSSAFSSVSSVVIAIDFK